MSHATLELIKEIRKNDINQVPGWPAHMIKGWRQVNTLHLVSDNSPEALKRRIKEMNLHKATKQDLKGSNK